MAFKRLWCYCYCFASSRLWGSSSLCQQSPNKQTGENIDCSSCLVLSRKKNIDILLEFKASYNHTKWNDQETHRSRLTWLMLQCLLIRQASFVITTCSVSVWQSERYISKRKLHDGGDKLQLSFGKLRIVIWINSCYKNVVLTSAFWK